MENLPAETLSQIIEYFTTGDVPIASFASVSPNFQSIVERHTFRNLKIESADINQFKHSFEGQKIARRAYLKNLTITFELPPEDTTDVCCDVVRRFDSSLDSESLTRDVSSLFAILHDFNVRAMHCQPISIEIKDFFRKSDRLLRGMAREYCREWRHKRRYLEPARQARSESWNLELSNVAQLPTVTGVSSLDIRPGIELCVIVQKIDGLKNVFFHIDDDRNWSAKKRSKRRQALEFTICRMPSSTLECLHFRTFHLSPKNESAPVPILTDPGLSDSWTNIIKRVASFPALKMLHMVGCTVISQDIFSDLVYDPNESAFPSLEHFRLDFSLETATGGWFVEMDQDAFEAARKDPEYFEYFEDLRQDFSSEDEPDDTSDDKSDHAAEGEDESLSKGENEGSDHKIEQEGEKLFPDADSPDANSNEGSDYKGCDCSESDCGCDSSPEEEYTTDSPVDPEFIRFRSKYRDATFVPLLVSTAELVRRMPQLKRCIIRLTDHGTTHRSGAAFSFPFLSRVFELWFMKAGTPRNERWRSPQVISEESILGRDRLFLRVGDGKLDERVKLAWSANVESSGVVGYLNEKWRMGPNSTVLYDAGEYGFMRYNRSGLCYNPFEG